MNFRNEFAKMIDDIKLGPDTPKEEFDRTFSPLMRFINNNLPERLFKFRACTEYSLDAFEKDELWLSKASLFNDLHDSLFFFDKTGILDSIEAMFSSGEALSMIKSIAQSQISNPVMRELIDRILASFDAQRLNDIALQSMPSFNVFLDQCFRTAKDGIRENTKMVCLSESIKSPLMWAHYADNNKGFALGYDFRNNEISQCSNCPNRSCGDIKLATIYPVIYSDKRFDATSFGQWHVLQYLNAQMGLPTERTYSDSFLFVKAALHKSNDWAYENEWRITCSTPNQLMESKDRYPIKKRPVAIYFGRQIPDIYRKMLMHIADEKGIARYQMYVKDYSAKYELDFEPV